MGAHQLTSFIGDHRELSMFDRTVATRWWRCNQSASDSCYPLSATLTSVSADLAILTGLESGMLRSMGTWIERESLSLHVYRHLRSIP